jgi:hypothetical protein
VQIGITASVWLPATSTACTSRDYEQVRYEICKPDILLVRYSVISLFETFKIALTTLMRFEKIMKLTFFYVPKSGLALIML